MPPSIPAWQSFAIRAAMTADTTPEIRICLPSFRPRRLQTQLGGHWWAAMKRPSVRIP